jgi:hypothetical protein
VDIGRNEIRKAIMRLFAASKEKELRRVVIYNLLRKDHSSGIVGWVLDDLLEEKKLVRVGNSPNNEFLTLPAKKEGGQEQKSPALFHLNLRRQTHRK